MKNRSAQKSLSPRKLLKRATTAFSKGRGDEVISCCQEILRSDPGNAKALSLLGKVYFAAGNYNVAGNLLQQAIAADAENIECYILLSRILEIQDKGSEAVRLMQRATQIAPLNADAHVTLVSLFTRFNHAHIVPDYLQRIMPRLGDNAEILQQYAMALKMNNRREEADEIYQDILTKHGVPVSFRIMYETYMPRITFSTEEIEQLRGNLSASIASFIEEKPQIDINTLSMHPLFALAYHNKDNKELMRQYSKMLRVCAPDLNYTAPHCKNQPSAATDDRKIRVGFASRHMHDHPVGRCYRNILVSMHESDDIDATLFLIHNFVDDKIRELQEMGINIISLPKNIKTSHKVIAEHELDILVYPDIGIDATTHYLAMARLAHYQCCMLGHPDTTGIDTIDYFISSTHYEPENAQDNYTEKLLLNDGIGSMFTKPQPPDKWYSRRELGLPEDKKLYVCPMAIQKLHPDFDDILAGIIEEDDNSVIVMFNDSYLKSASERLQDRILSKCPQQRVMFLGWQPMDKLLSCMKQADAVIDTIYFGAGTTSQYAFAYGIPIASMPGRQLRSRVVHSYYNIMGVEDAPTADTPQGYVSAAVRLANDASYKENISQQILDKNDVLFNGGGDYGKIMIGMMKDIVNQDLGKYLPSAQ